MAGLTELDLECLEYQEGSLSGLMMTAWGQPEQLTRYAFRYASVQALLGRVKEHDYYAGIAIAAAAFIGRPAARAWDKRSLRRRMFAFPGPRARWQQAYTDSLFLEAEDRLRNVSDENAAFRVLIAHHFDESGARVVS